MLSILELLFCTVRTYMHTQSPYKDAKNIGLLHVLLLGPYGRCHFSAWRVDDIAQQGRAATACSGA